MDKLVFVAPAPCPRGKDEEIVSRDGDQCNLFRVFGLDLGKRFAKALNPRFNMYISRMTGKFEPKMLPIKDEVATFWALNNI